VGQALGVTATLEGHEDRFLGNRVVLTGADVGGPQCESPQTIMADNRYYLAGGNLTECGVTLSESQAAGMDLRSTQGPIPDDATIIGWAQELLDF